MLLLNRTDLTRTAVAWKMNYFGWLATSVAATAFKHTPMRQPHLTKKELDKDCYAFLAVTNAPF